jgi:hypothetical protein
MKSIQWGKGTTSKASAIRPPDKATCDAKALHHRLRYERSLASAAAREAHLRSLMGLPIVPSPHRERGE